MDLIRRDSMPDHTAGPRVTTDFDFHVGSWRAHHRRLADPLSAGGHWIEFDSVLNADVYFNGALSVDEISLADPRDRGFTFRTYGSAWGEGSIYWVNSRVGRLDSPVQGRFADGVGTFYATEEIEGKSVLVRFVWSNISGTTARWQQAFSLDRGATWAETGR